MDSFFQTGKRWEAFVNMAMSNARWPFNKQMGTVQSNSLKKAHWLGKSKTAFNLSFKRVLLPSNGMSLEVVRTEVPNKQHEDSVASNNTVVVHEVS